MLLTEIKKHPTKKRKNPVINNLVAKHSYQRGGSHKDKKNDYERKPKHKKDLFNE